MTRHGLPASAIIALVGLLLAGCGPSQPIPDPVPESTESASYTGTLRSGDMAIGGEHTGWTLHEDHAGSGVELDVDRVRDRAAKLDGQRVSATGRLVRKEYVERGVIQVLVVESLVAAE